MTNDDPTALQRTGNFLTDVKKITGNANGINSDIDALKH
jgi:hypothetical protein